MTGPAAGPAGLAAGKAGPRRVVVLAGRRPGPDLLATSDGAAHRALLDIEGEPMLVRVVRQLLAWPSVERVLVNIDRIDLLEAQPEIVRWQAAGRLELQASTDSPSRSVLASLDHFDLARGPVLVTTADHALLDAAMLEHFFAASAATSADLTLALVPRSRIVERFPQARRTYLKFRGEAYSGANLFLFRTPRSREAALFWQRVERLRKTPWRIARAFGLRNLARFVLRRWTLEQAFSQVSRVIGIEARAIALQEPEAAVDVDKLDDLLLVREILAERRAARGGAGRDERPRASA